MKVNNIYQEYQIPKNLQEHMLRVAALAEIILENWKGEQIDKRSIVIACVLHDLAKPMNFDLSKQAKFGLTPEEIEDLAKLQNRLRNDFGKTEHQALINICKSLGCSPVTIRIIENFEWEFIPRLMIENDMESLVAIYSDMRIGLKGILSLKDRLEDLKTRESADDYQEKETNGFKLENLIMKNNTVDLNSIKDEQINARFEDLLDIEI